MPPHPPPPPRPESAGAILVAAGESQRLPGPPRKPLRLLCGIPLFLYSLRTLLKTPEIGPIALVIHPDDEREVEPRLELETIPPGRLKTVPGGAVRAESVLFGLEALLPVERVLVHDAARPLASPALFSRIAGALENAQAVIPAIPLEDTVKEVRGEQVLRTLPRDPLRRVQTPQGFRAGPLRELLTENPKGWVEITDEAQLFEKKGIPVIVLPGERWNLKITHPEDLELAANYLKTHSNPCFSSKF